jgi:hypothetical protein
MRFLQVSIGDSVRNSAAGEKRDVIEIEPMSIRPEKFVMLTADT